MRIISGILLLTCLVSCLPSTLNQLRSESTPVHFLADTTYQAAYRDLRLFLDKCIPGGFLLATNNIQGNLYTDIAAGDITVSNNNMGDKSVMLHIELHDAKGKTEITTYSAQVGLWKDYSKVIRQHMLSGSNECTLAEDK